MRRLYERICTKIDNENDDSRYKIGKENHPSLRTKAAAVVYVSGIDSNLDRSREVFFGMLSSSLSLLNSGLDGVEPFGRFCWSKA